MTTGLEQPPKRSKPLARILIVDDHPIVRQGLARMIAEEPDLEVCGEAEDASQALRQVTESKPDLVIIDISLKSGTGIELIKQIKARDEQVRMLVSSMHDESLFAERSLRAGAMGYINKQEAADKIIGAIRSVLQGKIYLSSQLTDRVLHRMIGGKHPEGSPVEGLSDRELEVFELIGSGLTTRQIAAKLHLSPKTVETHRENIKKKLNLVNAIELTRYAVEWVLEHG